AARQAEAPVQAETPSQVPAHPPQEEGSAARLGAAGGARSAVDPGRAAAALELAAAERRRPDHAGAGAATPLARGLRPRARPSRGDGRPAARGGRAVAD